MDTKNSLAEVFRFVQLRPPKPAAQIKAVPLVGTELARELGEARTVGERIALADRALGDARWTISSADQLRLGARLLGALSRTRTREQATTADLLAEIGDPGDIVSREEFAVDRTRLSDTLLAALLGTEGAKLDLRTLGELFRVYVLLTRAAAGAKTDAPLDGFLARPLVVPPGTGPDAAGRRDASVIGPYGAVADEHPRPASDLRAMEGGGKVAVARDGRLPGSPEVAAIQELARLDHTRNIVQPADGGGGTRGRAHPVHADTRSP